MTPNWHPAYGSGKPALRSTMVTAINTRRITKRLHPTVACIGVFLLFTGTVGWAEDLDFGLLFTDAKGLEPGYALMYRGVRVGAVRDVSLDPGGQVLVRVRVLEEYRDSVYREADFIIERSGARITMRDRAGRRSPIRADDILTGSGMLGHIVGRLGERLDWFGAVSAAGLVALTDVVAEQLASSPAAQELGRALREFADGLPLPGGPEYDRFVERWVPDLRKLGQRYMGELEKNGPAGAAQTFWEDFTSWLSTLIQSTR